VDLVTMCLFRLCVVLDSQKTLEGSFAAFVAQLTSVIIIERIGELC